MKPILPEHRFFGRLGEPSLPFGRPAEPFLTISQAEDPTRTSGSENRMPGTARPRVRKRGKRPGFNSY